MISMFKYASTTVASLFIDIHNYADINAIKNNQQNWFIADVCVNDSIIALRKTFELSGVQITSDYFATALSESFNDAGLDSKTVSLTKNGEIFFSFKNNALVIVAKNETLDYIYNLPAYACLADEYKMLNSWSRLIETLNDLF